MREPSKQTQATKQLRATESNLSQGLPPGPARPGLTQPPSLRFPGTESPARSLKPQVWVKTSRLARAAQVSVSLRCPRPGNPCSSGFPKPGLSPSQTPGALKCSVDSRAPGMRGPKSAQDRACSPGQHNPGGGWRRITAEETQQPYSPCRAVAGKEERAGLWEKESRPTSTTSGLPGGGERKRRYCDASSARRGGKGVKASGAGPRESRSPSQLPVVGPRLLRGSEAGRGLRFFVQVFRENGILVPRWRGEG